MAELSVDELAGFLKDLNRGIGLSSEEVANCWRQLEIDQNDFSSRLMLVSFYGNSPSNETEDSIKKFYDLTLWLIKKSPGHQIHQFIARPHNNRYFDEMKNEWLEQTDHFPDKVHILDNAAIFMKLRDLHQSEQLWQRAEELEPLNDRWAMCLSNLYQCWINRVNDVERERLIDKTIESGERALRLHMQDHPACHLAYLWKNVSSRTYYCCKGLAP